MDSQEFYTLRSVYTEPSHVMELDFRKTAGPLDQARPSCAHYARPKAPDPWGSLHAAAPPLSSALGGQVPCVTGQRDGPWC